MNPFGAFHDHADPIPRSGPTSYASEDRMWKDAWLLRPQGVTRAPVLEICETS